MSLELITEKELEDIEGVAISDFEYENIPNNIDSILVRMDENYFLIEGKIIDLLKHIKSAPNYVEIQMRDPNFLSKEERSTLKNLIDSDILNFKGMQTSFGPHTYRKHNITEEYDYFGMIQIQSEFYEVGNNFQKSEIIAGRIKKPFQFLRKHEYVAVN